MAANKFLRSIPNYERDFYFFQCVCVRVCPLVMMSTQLSIVLAATNRFVSVLVNLWIVFSSPASHSSPPHISTGCCNSICRNGNTQILIHRPSFNRNNFFNPYRCNWVASECRCSIDKITPNSQHILHNNNNNNNNWALCCAHVFCSLCSLREIRSLTTTSIV